MQTQTPTPAPTTSLAPTTAAPTTLAPTTLAPTTLAPTTVTPTPTTATPVTPAPTTATPVTPTPTTATPVTAAPTTSAPITMAPTVNPTCYTFDTTKYGAKKPALSAYSNGNSVSITVSMNRQDFMNYNVPVFHTLDTTEARSNQCLSSDSIAVSAGRTWYVSQNGCAQVYTITQSLSDIVSNTSNNNWIAALSDDGRAITYSLPIYATFSVHTAGTCYYVGYQFTVSFQTKLNVASVSSSFTTSDESVRFAFSGLRITSAQNLEIAGTIIPLIAGTELRDITLTKHNNGLVIPTNTTTCNNTNVGCDQIYSIGVALLGGAGADISDQYDTTMSLFRDNVWLLATNFSYFLSYSIPNNPVILDSDTITTAVKLYTDNTYTSVRTATYTSAFLYIENSITPTSPAIPSTYRLRMSEGYLCCVPYLTSIDPYDANTGFGGCKNATGKVEWFSFGSEAGHPASVLFTSASAAAPKKYRVQLAFSDAYSTIVHPSPLTCEVLLISKLENSVRRIGAASNLNAAFVSTTQFAYAQGPTPTTSITPTPVVPTTTAPTSATQKIEPTQKSIASGNLAAYTTLLVVAVSVLLM
jgi:hypothetical protein